METFQLYSGTDQNRTVGRVLRITLIVSVSLAVVLLLMLVSSASNSGLFQQYYAVMIWVTIAVAAGLFLLVLDLLRRLVIRYRQGAFGTRLMSRLALSFTLMTVIPVLLIYLVALQFVGRSIESWFDLPVERALESGLNLGRASLDNFKTDVVSRARTVGAELADLPQSQWSSALLRLQDQYRLQEAMVLTGAGRVVISNGTGARLFPDVPSSDVLRRVRLMRTVSEFEGGVKSDSGQAADNKKPEVSSKGVAAPAADAAASTETNLKVRVITIVIGDSQRLEDNRYLQVLQSVPTALAENAEAISQGRTDYRQLLEAKDGLKEVYRITLTLIFLLTVFSAIAGAFLLSGWLTGPLSMLAAGTKAVAEGNFAQVKDYGKRDELGVLTQSFNAMTRQLEEARREVEANQSALEQANLQLETVLTNLTAGVLVLDQHFVIRLANPASARILKKEPGHESGSRASSLAASELAETFVGLELSKFEPFVGIAESIHAAYAELESSKVRFWQRQFTLSLSGTLTQDAGQQRQHERKPEQLSEQTLLMRGSHLPEATNTDTQISHARFVLVFDDISEVISAQRSVAWAEVAQRVAHEIKNPLTPIQLAAERTRMKLFDKLGTADAELLDRNTRTIVDQVSALKLMVDEFRDFARLPSSAMAELDLNALVSELATLYDASPRNDLKLHLDSNAPRIIGDSKQLRQIIHNLLKNAFEAYEALPSEQRPEVRWVEVRTETIKLPEAIETDGTAPLLAVKLWVRDRGPGFASASLARIFEPYITTKPKGSGLGLAIVKKIADEHDARLEVANWSSKQPEIPISGAQVSMLFTKIAKSVDNTVFPS
jgi:nitrogen fixation/metabolism regulation signal transduction histidine kinase